MAQHRLENQRRRRVFGVFQVPVRQHRRQRLQRSILCEHGDQGRAHAGRQQVLDILVGSPVVSSVQLVLFHDFHDPPVAPVTGEMGGIGIGVILCGHPIVGRTHPALARIQLQGHLLRRDAAGPVILLPHQLWHQAITLQADGDQAGGDTRHVAVDIRHDVIEGRGNVTNGRYCLVSGVGQQQLQVARIRQGKLGYRPAQRQLQTVDYAHSMVGNNRATVCLADLHDFAAVAALRFTIADEQFLTARRKGL